MRRILTMLTIGGLLLSMVGCATTPRTYEGGAVGAAAGAVAGALLDRHNPWRGGVIGGVIGAIAGATITEISARASREAAMEQRPVEYRTEDGRGIYRADPMGPYDPRTRCSKIRERVWEDGRLVKDQTREVCESTMYQRRY